MKIFLSTVLMSILAISNVQAGATCTGVIREVNNYNTLEDLYILLDNTSHYISLQTQTAKSMALTAFASGKEVVFHMIGDDITTCSGGPANNSWGNSTPLYGWIHVKK